MSVDSLMAKLGPQTFRVPGGARRNVSGLKPADKTLRKVRRALELSSVGVESSTRSHGTETRSYDIQALSPQDIAAAVGFIRDELSRELFCLAHWPGYSDRMPNAQGEAIEMMARRLNDEFEHRLGLANSERMQRTGKRDPNNPRNRLQMSWPMPCGTYEHLATIAVMSAGAGMPGSGVIAKLCGISDTALRASWRDVIAWIDADVSRMLSEAESGFKRAIKA